MATNALSIAVTAGTLLLYGSTSVNAQEAPQIPTLQVCNNLAKVEGQGAIEILSRRDPNHSGVFKLKVEVKCDPKGLGFPEGDVQIAFDMSDTVVQGELRSVSFEQLTILGKHSPTAYMSGRCKAEGVSGCRFWLTIADNKRGNGQGSPDVVGILVLNGVGRVVAYGTGSLVGGDFDVPPS